MKHIITALTLLPLSALAMQKSPATFPVILNLTQGDQQAAKNAEISLNKETKVVFDSFTSPLPGTRKYTYTVTLLALRHSKISLLNKKETVNVKITVEREQEHSGKSGNGGDIGDGSKDQKNLHINEHKDIDFPLMGEYGKVTLGLTVGSQGTAPQAKL